MIREMIKDLIAQARDPRNDGYVAAGLRKELEELKLLIEKGLEDEGKDRTIYRHLDGHES